MAGKVPDTIGAVMLGAAASAGAAGRGGTAGIIAGLLVLAPDLAGRQVRARVLAARRVAGREEEAADLRYTDRLSTAHIRAPPAGSRRREFSFLEWAPR